MTQSPLHVAIIMDGNGRWAARRGLPRIAGHEAGGQAVRCVIEAAPALGIDRLTLYAFSNDNWGRPAAEVAALMKLFEHYLRAEMPRAVREGVRVRVIGRRDRLAASLVEAIETTERATARERRLDLRIAVDYSSLGAVVDCLRRLKGRPAQAALSQALEPPVDLLIRTGGEQRLSDFLLWECAYAELYFTPVMWPDFSRSDLEAALADFHSRQRRFGLLPEVAAG